MTNDWYHRVDADERASTAAAASARLRFPTVRRLTAGRLVHMLPRRGGSRPFDPLPPPTSPPPHGTRKLESGRPSSQISLEGAMTNLRQTLAGRRRRHRRCGHCANL